MRRYAGGMPLLTDLGLAMMTDPLALNCDDDIRPAVTFAFPDAKVEAYRRSVLHLNLNSAVDGSILNDRFRDRMDEWTEGISGCSQSSRI